MIKRVLVTILLSGALLVSGCESEKTHHLTGATMGTTYNVTIVGPSDKPLDADALQAEVDAELVRVNALMSTYIPDSELSRFNDFKVDEWFPVSKDMIKILRLARAINQDSAGSFDVTVGPLVNLWGFGPTPVERRVPDEAEINSARANVGFEHLEIGEGAIRKSVPLYVDLSAIAKGYGVDLVAELLLARGIENFLVEIGGELRSAGVNDRGAPWRIAIEKPEANQLALSRTMFRTVDLTDMALATSGDYRNFFELDGERYSHTIDPTTGTPISHSLASVTVLAPTCAMADGVATAINVMGPERGLALAAEKNLPVFAIIKSGSGFTESWSSAFEPYLK